MPGAIATPCDEQIYSGLLLLAWLLNDKQQQSADNFIQLSSSNLPMPILLLTYLRMQPSKQCIHNINSHVPWYHGQRVRQKRNTHPHSQTPSHHTITHLKFNNENSLLYCITWVIRLISSQYVWLIHQCAFRYNAACQPPLSACWLC